MLTTYKHAVLTTFCLILLLLFVPCGWTWNAKPGQAAPNCRSRADFVRRSAHSSRFEEYEEKRERIIDQLKNRSLQYDEPLSSDEKIVDLYLQYLKHENYPVPGENSFLPMQNFITVREQIEDTDLFAFLKRMPKGAILHIHELAMGDYKWIINHATYRNDCYIYKDRDGGIPYGALAIFETPPESRSWVPVNQDRASSGNERAYDEALYDSLVINADEAADFHIWNIFLNIFDLLQRLFNNADFTKEYYRRAFEYLATNDHVNHVEIRFGLPADQISIIQDVIHEMAAAGSDFSARLIYYRVRSKSPSQSEEQYLADIKSALFECSRLMQKYPKLVIGFDLVGDEDTGYPTSFLAATLDEAESQLGCSRKRVPFYLHDGESNWSPDYNVEPYEYIRSYPTHFNNNLVDAYLLGSKRVGHGLTLTKTPYLMRLYKRADIALEICPISNQVLQFVPDLRNHPAVSYLNEGLGITINPDDPSIFQYQGVTHDFWEACMAWDLDLRALKQLAINSIDFSGLAQVEKHRLHAVWDKQWQVFIAEMKSQATLVELDERYRENQH